MMSRKMLAQVPLDHQSLTDTERACLVAARRSVKAALEHSYRCTEARLLNRTIDVAWSRFVELGVNAGNMLRNGIHGSTPLRLVYIPAGEFMMGSPQNEPGRSDNEGPQHKVKIAKPFYMGVYAVTTEQWFSVMGNKYTVVPSGEPYPRTGITWEDACEFCRKLSQQTGRNFHLPTEAQREYACRAGSKTAYFYGEDPTGSRLNEFAWSIIGRENWKTRGSPLRASSSPTTGASTTCWPMPRNGVPTTTPTVTTPKTPRTPPAPFRAQSTWSAGR